MPGAHANSAHMDRLKSTNCHGPWLVRPVYERNAGRFSTSIVAQHITIQMQITLLVSCIWLCTWALQIEGNTADDATNNHSEYTAQLANADYTCSGFVPVRFLFPLSLSVSLLRPSCFPVDSLFVSLSLPLSLSLSSLSLSLCVCLFFCIRACLPFGLP